MEELEDEAFNSELLLGWVYDYEERYYTSLQDLFDSDALDELVETVSDSWLHAALSEATQKRVSREILSPAGLYAVRWLAACMQSTNDPLNAILSRISSRLSKRPQDWLNSLALVGKGIAYGVDFDE